MIPDDSWYLDLNGVGIMKLKIAGLILVICICIAGIVTSAIPEGKGNQVVISSTSGSLSAPDAEISEKLDEYMTALTDAGRFSGSVLIGQGDTILFSKGYGNASQEFAIPNTPQTVFPIGSNTKQITAAAIMKLQEQGKLNITDPVTKYIPDASNWKNIRIFHLLNHTSGIPTDGGFLMSDPVNYPLPELIEKISALPLTFEPGSNNSYSNNGYITLSYIVELVSGMSFEDYLKENFFQPLHMNSTGQDNAREVFTNRSSGYSKTDGKYIHYDLQNIHNSYGAGCIHSTTEDLFKWERGFATPGVVLSSQSINGLRENHYGINKQEKDNLTFLFHGGRNFGFISLTFYNPEEDISIIFLSNYDRTPLSTLMKDLPAIVFHKPYSLPEKVNQKTIFLSPEELAEYSGTYAPEYEKSWTFTVYPVDTHLFYDSIVPRETVELFFAGNDTFFVTPESNDAFIFTRNDTGLINGMKMYTMEGNIDSLAKIV